MRRLSDVATLLDIKISDLKSRLMLAWAVGPEISVLRAADLWLAMKLSTLIYVAIPRWKETAAPYAAALRSQGAPAAARPAQSATISADALNAQTDAVIKAIDNLIDTLGRRADARQVAVAAITKNINKLRASQ